MVKINKLEKSKTYRIRKVMAEVKVLNVLSILFNQEEDCQATFSSGKGFDLFIHIRKGRFRLKNKLHFS